MLSYETPAKRATRTFAIVPCVVMFAIPSIVPPYVYATVGDLAQFYKIFGLKLTRSAQVLVDYTYWYGDSYGWIWIAAVAITSGFAYPPSFQIDGLTVRAT